MRRPPAVPPELRVEEAMVGEPRDREVLVGAVPCPAGDDDLPVRLRGNIEGLFGLPPERECSEAVPSPESGVRRPVLAEPRDGEVVVGWGGSREPNSPHLPPPAPALKRTIRTPSPENDVSRTPLGFSRAKAKSPPPTEVVPPTMIRPSGRTSAAAAASAAERSILRRPSPANDVSSPPVARNLATSM